MLLFGKGSDIGMKYSQLLSRHACRETPTQWHLFNAAQLNLAASKLLALSVYYPGYSLLRNLIICDRLLTDYPQSFPTALTFFPYLFSLEKWGGTAVKSRFYFTSETNQPALDKKEIRSAYKLISYNIRLLTLLTTNPTQH